MLYDSILARSFSKHEQKKFRNGAFFGCLVIALSLCTVFRSYLGPLSPLKLRVSMGVGLKMLMVRDASSFPFIIKDQNSSQHLVDDHISNYRKIVINITANNSQSQLIITNNDTNKSQHKANVLGYCSITQRSDFCEIEDDIRIEASSGTVFISSSSSSQTADIMINSSWIMRPYARKADETAMSRVRKWSVKSVRSHQEVPKCTQNHRIPAILFSNGGYAGNHFHDFTDIIVPLYLTSRQFNGEVRFLVTNKRSFWIEKFRQLLRNLSNYDIIDIDQESDKVHCFPRGIIGLKAHDKKELSIDPSKSSPYTMKDFRQFLRSCYSLQKPTAITIKEGEKERPRLLIISRKRTRIFTNTDKIARMAKHLGYKVVVAEANMSQSRFAETVNSCDVLMGVHGAGLTNIVFLPENAVLIQVVPIAVEGMAREYFEEPSKAMKLRYLEYKIKAEESSLIQKYPLGHQVLRDPYSIAKQGWSAFKSLYLDKQNVQLDLIRVRGTLLKALELLQE